MPAALPHVAARLQTQDLMVPYNIEQYNKGSAATIGTAFREGDAAD